MRGARSLLLLLLAASAAAQEPERPRVGLVLSGGGARGAAHVGIIEVLEELRIPVDVVVGTSMGSIVGGLYAAGYAPGQMAHIIETADWEVLLSDEPPRSQLWFRRRQDRRRFLVDLELGWRDGGPALPPGLIQGRNVEAFLEGLMLPVALRPNFDQLQIPFRCVATDLADGSAVVFSTGDLATAIRASMSLPGIFAPVHYDGRTLVDGGIVDNVPVDVARDLGADVLIVVDISTPLAKPETIQSLLGVSDQVMGILMSVNRDRSMESLTGDDIGIVPELGDLSTLSFDRCEEAVEIGRQAARQAREQLARLSVDEATWTAWRARQRIPDTGPLVIRHLTIDEKTRLSGRIISERAGLAEGDVLDRRALDEARQRLGGLGIFERIQVEIAPVAGSPGEADVVLRPIEKGWGPHYLRFGLGAASDLTGGGEFDLGIQHTWTPINSMGGEWRNEAQIGTRTRLFSEFYQPFDRHLRWFVAPSIEFQQDNVPIIVDRQKVAQVNAEGIQLAMAVGRNLGSWGEVRTQYGWVAAEVKPDIAFPGILPPSSDVRTAQLVTSLTVDTLDNLRFPQRGVVGRASWELTDESLGSDEETSVGEVALGTPVTSGRLTVFPQVEAGTTFDGQGLVGSEFFLGGFQRLSGLGSRELSGNHYGLGVVQSYYQLSQRTTRYGVATYLGGSVELGGIWNQRDEVNGRDLLLGGSVFLAVDSVVGPAYLAFGATEGGNRAVYVFIGPTF